MDYLGGRACYVQVIKKYNNEHNSEAGDQWRFIRGSTEGLYDILDRYGYTPAFLRMDDGIPAGNYRIRALGNSVVPVQATEAFRILMGMGGGDDESS